METTVRTQDDVVVVSVAGRIDQASSEAFKEALAPHLERCRQGGPALVLDFSGVDYISSIGLRVLMLAARQVTAQAGRIAIAALTPVVDEVFRISRFNIVFKVYDRVDAAIAALK